MARLDVVAGEGKTGGGWGLADRGEALRTGAVLLQAGRDRVGGGLVRRTGRAGSHRGGAPTGGVAGTGWGAGVDLENGWCGFAAGADLWGRSAPGVVLLQDRGFTVGAPPSVRRGRQNQLSCISMQVWSRASSRFSSWLQAGTSQVRK